MAIVLDGFATLRRIGDRREVFSAARFEADKAARAIVVTCLKAKTLDLAGLRAVHEALGADAFALIVHELKDFDTRALLKRLDSHAPDLTTAQPAARTRHVLALAQGEANPTAAPQQGGRKVSAKTRAPRRIESALMKAFAKGGRDDA